jgi:hypothetical protein
LKKGISWGMAIAFLLVALFIFFLRVRVLELFRVPRRVEKGRVLELSFEEGLGSIAYDSSEYKNDATLRDLDEENEDKIALPSWVEGRRGYALQFDGIDDCLFIKHSSSFEISENLTILYWFKALGWGSLDRTNLVYKGWNWRSSFTGDGRIYLEFILRDGTRVPLYSPQLSLDRWYHVAYTFSKGEARLYLDGELVYLAEFGFMGLKLNSEPLQIGCGAYHLWGEEAHFLGAIDELLIYNQVLKKEEIEAEFRRGFEKY